ncbi:hypothetical protein Pla123a_06620 [Posidoniimonas polymericola]|uniref:Ice-binding protein C-terminal domain-containing protein n=1 Tax=Posidoniimonas polymericola TaxID=2528002 RepID=A0A5C5ZFG7_9BACT|nr:PEP-CTERM sorting domain-containing protein [Posidoniimonas polymericola]TWT85855.1 hypothetical protein Pla123a_06620 [Posidoniimonas polymericola]
MKSFFALLIVAAFAANASAVSIFLGTSATDPSATDLPEMRIGDTAELYIWITPDAGTKINGASFDILADPGGVVGATDISVLNPNVFGVPAWQGSVKLGDLGSDTMLVNGTLAVAVTSQGINQQLNGFGADPRNFAGSWNYGSLSIEALAGGTTNLYAAANATNPFTVEGQGGVQFDAPTFAVNVVGIPEPATMGLAGLAIAGVLGFRRRR